MASQNVEFKVGLFILVGVVMIVASLYWLQGYRLAANAQVITVFFEDIGTLATGPYVCEVPHPEAVLRGSVVDGAGFTIVTASSYRAQGTLGSYLLTGADMVFTSGPRKGERYRRISSGSVRKLDADGAETPLRCVLSNRNNR